MNQAISILGCGWLGIPLASSMARKAYNIKGSTTSLDKLDKLKSIGISPFIVDLNNLESDISLFLSSDILIILIPSKSIHDFKKLIEKIEASQIKKMIFVSSTSVYPNTNGLVTEATPVISSPLSEIEELFRSSPSFKSTIIRFGGLFGYDRKPGNFIRSGQKIKNPEGYVNMIHTDDCVRIVEQIIESDTWGVTLNACADFHPIRKDYYKKEMVKVGRAVPELDKDSSNDYKIVSSDKLKSLLGFSFNHSDL